MTSLKVGQKAPLFTLPSINSGKVSLKDLLGGKWIVLYFYPKDNTPGCSLQAQGFRDVYKDFQKKNVTILGVSPDSLTRHKTFKEKFNLPFDLLSDVDHKVSEKYGIWAQKKMYGRSFYGILRTTFLIAPDGKIRYIFSKVKPKGHELVVLDVLADMLNPT